MLPSWTKPALLRVGILLAACVVILVGVKLVGGSLGKSAETPPQQPPAPAGDISDKQIIAAIAPETPVKQAAKSLPNPTPAIVLKKEETKTGQDAPAKELKMISLGEAVSLVEKAGKGEPVLAEKVGEGAKAQFNVDVLGVNGAKSRFNVNATGKVIVEVPVATKKGPAGTTDRKKSTREKGSPEREREREDR